MIEKQVHKFKDEKGKWRTQSLFYEAYLKSEVSEKYPPIYTLKDADYKKFISIKAIYLSLEDPTEYRIATEYFGGWDHWKTLCATVWFGKHIEEWREELEIKMKCKYIQKIKELSDTTGAVAKDASKFIINKEWETKRGRPSKEEVEKRNRIDSNVKEQIEADFKLLNIK